jgi:hypothetical protein
MRENNLFSFPNKPITDTIPPKKEKRKASNKNFKTIELIFVEKSAQDFVNSIVLGDLYKELKPKKSNPVNNITHI